MTELYQDRKSELPANQPTLSPQWAVALTEFAALTDLIALSYTAKDPYHTGYADADIDRRYDIHHLTQITELSLQPHYPLGRSVCLHKPHKEEEEEEKVFIEKAEFDEDIVSAAAKMNCSGEQRIIKYVEETYGCILAYRDADGERKAGYIVKGVI